MASDGCTYLFNMDGRLYPTIAPHADVVHSDTVGGGYLVFYLSLGSEIERTNWYSSLSGIESGTGPVPAGNQNLSMTCFHGLPEGSRRSLIQHYSLKLSNE